MKINTIYYCALAFVVLTTTFTYGTTKKIKGTSKGTSKAKTKSIIFFTDEDKVGDVFVNGNKIDRKTNEKINNKNQHELQITAKEGDTITITAAKNKGNNTNSNILFKLQYVNNPVRDNTYALDNGEWRTNEQQNEKNVIEKMDFSIPSKSDGKAGSNGKQQGNTAGTNSNVNPIKNAGSNNEGNHYNNNQPCASGTNNGNNGVPGNVNNKAQNQNNQGNQNNQNNSNNNPKTPQNENSNHQKKNDNQQNPNKNVNNPSNKSNQPNVENTNSSGSNANENKGTNTNGQIYIEAYKEWNCDNLTEEKVIFRVLPMEKGENVVQCLSNDGKSCIFANNPEICKQIVREHLVHKKTTFICGEQACKKTQKKYSPMQPKEMIRKKLIQKLNQAKKKAEQHIPDWIKNIMQDAYMKADSKKSRKFKKL